MLIRMRVYDDIDITMKFVRWATAENYYSTINCPNCKHILNEL